MGEQGAADRDPLLLAAGQRGGAAFQQMADAQQLDDRGEIGSAPPPASRLNQRP